MVVNVQADSAGFGVLTATEIIGGYIGLVTLPIVTIGPVQAASSSVSTSLDVPQGAVVTQALLTVTAHAPGTTTIGDIATVRAAAGLPEAAATQLVVDFGTLRTVSQLSAPVGISAITPWVGTKFDGALTLSPGSGSVAAFTEVQTERLLVELASSTAPASLASSGTVTTTTPPADLELAVGGVRVWFRAGPAPAGFSEEVDVTAALQGAVDGATVVDDGDVTVPVVLTARVPGTIGLSQGSDVRFLRTHAVAFPGPTTTVVFDEEDVTQVELPLPPTADASAPLTIHRVVATVTPTDPGPERVLPPDRPVVSTDAQLRLDPDRRLVVRLPRAPLAAFERLVGIRLLLAPEAGGIEIGGALSTGTASTPGAPVPGAALTPVSLAQGPQAWVTLRLPKPVVLGTVLEPAPDDHLWVSIGVPRGSALLALADPTAMGEGDRALLRRVGANGLTRPLSTAYHQRAALGDPLDPVDADTLALRVVGIAPPAAPVEVVATDLVGTQTVVQPGPAGSVAVTFTPPEDHTTLALRLTATAATSVTVGPVVVAYTDSSES